jgi:hypothetical protein
MSKFWLILWFFTIDGEFIEKDEFSFNSRAECVQAAGEVAKKFVNQSVSITSFCVTDNHHKGISVDPGIPLD